MVEQLKERYGQLPDEYLADAGFVHLDDIKQLTEWGVTPYLPIKDEKKMKSTGVDPYAAKAGDSPEVIAWRALAHNFQRTLRKVQSQVTTFSPDSRPP